MRGRLASDRVIVAETGKCPATGDRSRSRGTVTACQRSRGLAVGAGLRVGVKLGVLLLGATGSFGFRMAHRTDARSGSSCGSRQGQASKATADQFGTNPNSVAAERIYDCVVGELKLFAGIVGEGIPAEGQLLQIAENTALFPVMGTSFGGDGRTTFGVPDMRPAAPNGTAYYLCDFGIFPSRR